VASRSLLTCVVFQVKKKHCFNANDMILYAILTCAPELTQVSLIYHMEPTTKKWIKEKIKSKNGSAQKYW